jgi:hypothetical protein
MRRRILQSSRALDRSGACSGFDFVSAEPAAYRGGAGEHTVTTFVARQR